jgi:FMN phosphatase YigB (HAD superfamily)
MIKAIIFDCFGVVFLDHFGKVYEHFGGDLEKDAEFIEQFFFDVSKGKKDWFEGIENKLGITRAEWDKAREEIVGFNLELLEYIDELRKSYKIGLLSNVGTEGLEAFMDYSVLEEHFDLICESSKIGFAKPEARAYEVAADILGVRLDECVFTDDRQPYIEGAQHVGMKTILYTSFEEFRLELEKVLYEVDS